MTLVSDLEILNDAMTDAALALTEVVGLEGIADCSIDEETIPAPVLRAARMSLTILTIGIGLCDGSPAEELDDAGLNALLDMPPKDEPEGRA